MAFAYKTNDPALRDFARWIVANMIRSHDMLIQIGLDLYGEHRWGNWSVVAAERSVDWMRRCAQLDDSAPRPIKGGASAQAAGETIVAMLKAGEISWSAREKQAPVA